MYVSPNCKSKAELKRRLVAGETIEVFSAGPFPAPRNADVSIEGPHYPEPHRWYARVRVVNGIVTKVLS